MVWANELLARPRPTHSTPPMVWQDQSHQSRPRMPYRFATMSEMMPPVARTQCHRLVQKMTAVWCHIALGRYSEASSQAAADVGIAIGDQQDARRRASTDASQPLLT